MPLDHSDERRRLIGLRGNLDTSIRAMGDAADTAFLLGLKMESDDLRACQDRLRSTLAIVEKRIER